MTLEHLPQNHFRAILAEWAPVEGIRIEIERAP